MSKKILFIDLDKTLIVESSIEVFAKAWDFSEELAQLRKQVKRGDIPDQVITQTLVKHYEGRTPEGANNICSSLTLSEGAEQLVDYAKEHDIQVWIVSAAYSPVVSYVAEKLGIENFVCPQVIIDDNGHYVGSVEPSPFADDGSCCGLYFCKRKAILDICQDNGVAPQECIGLGDGTSDRCMFEVSGLSLGYKTNLAEHRISNLSEVIMFLS